MIYNELKRRGTEDFPIELYRIEEGHTRYEMAAHWHGEMEIIRVLRGQLHVKLNNMDYCVRENEILFVNPETVHRATPDCCSYECIVFQLGVIPPMNSGSIYFPESLINHEYRIEPYHTTSSPLVEAVDALFCALYEKTSGYKFKVIGALCNLFGVIMDAQMYQFSGNATVSADKNVPKLRSVLAFIRSNYDMQITLSDMAEAAGMSSKYFCYFFKEMTEKTPVEYLLHYRIEKAARKLLNSDMSVTAIAYSCGFNDLSYFIKTFKKIQGATPAKYRKEAHG